jgi:syntaxin 5
VAIDMSGMQMQQQAMVPLNSTYYESRAQAVESVQTTIAELGNIFQQLGTMVQSHGEMIQRVDENVEESLANVTMGHEQLQLYWRNMQGNRGLMMKIFAVLFFFIVIWGTLFA